MDKKVKISLKNGTEVFLADLKPTDLPQVKLEAKDGKEWLTMKSEVIAENETHYTERRLYKWNVMPALVMYDLPYPKDTAGCVKEMGEKVAYNHLIRDFIIASDKEHNGIVSDTKGKKEEKMGNSLLDRLVASGASKAEVEATRKALLKAGFLK